MAVVPISSVVVGAPGGGEDSEVFTVMSIADSYTIRNNRRTVLHFVKTGAGAAVITFITPANLSGYDVEDPTITVPATTGDIHVALGKLGAVFNDANGDVSFSTDEDTALSVSVVEIG